jgi:phosphoenolpyruvate carboxykinase (ATP)
MSVPAIDLASFGLSVARVLRNPSPALLYEDALRNEAGARIADSGALVSLSGKRTGRSPLDKRVVDRAPSNAEIWWGKVNIRLEDEIFVINRERAIDYLNTRETLYVVDGFAGWDLAQRVKVRVICARAYHALFMHTMLIRPDPPELEAFGTPDFVILNAGRFPANRHTRGMTSQTTIDLCFERRQMVILGTEYAGEMKKGVFTLMNYLLPRRGVLSMHCSANEGAPGNGRDSGAAGEGRSGAVGDVSLFFGLSGTGKTTLSADPRRRLIGDDEHGWSDDGVFNIEGGCYAKTIGLDPASEPQIHAAIRYGTVLENVVVDPDTRRVDYADGRITTNTRAAYPVEYIPNAKIPCVGGHPTNIIFLTCDAFGVLPPVARLDADQAMYHFLSGYTAKVAGTEVGVTEPETTFSACFGAPFLALPPSRYATLLAEKIRRHGSHVWLVNTGWSGGPADGEEGGKRLPIAVTRALIDAIHDGALASSPTRRDPFFGFEVPVACAGIDARVLDPRASWKDPGAWDRAAAELANRFRANFQRMRDENLGGEIHSGGPM